MNMHDLYRVLSHVHGMHRWNFYCLFTCYPDAYLEGNTCKCRPGYLFFQPTKQCVIYCSPGYYREETNICTLCPQNCQLCDYHDKCLLCDTFLVNFVHLTDIYLECLEICPTGYYADSDQNCQSNNIYNLSSSSYNLQYIYIYRVSS